MSEKELNQIYKDGDFLLAYHPNQSGSGNVDRIFHKLVEEDYVALWMLFGDTGELDMDRKLYLEDISDRWKISIDKVTALVRRLADKGYVRWKHDGTGEEGTYIQITEKGIVTANRMKKNTEALYTEVIERFGQSRFVQLMNQMAELKEIVNAVIHETGESMNGES
jgi:DNA-binding MarR family transcriptional regulator